jgi:hypothetical protein
MIVTIGFEFEVIEEDLDTSTKPEDGAYVYVSLNPRAGVKLVTFVVMIVYRKILIQLP